MKHRRCDSMRSWTRQQIKVSDQH